MSVVIIGDHSQSETPARGGWHRADLAAFLGAAGKAQREKHFGRYAYFPKAHKPGETYRDSRGQLLQVTEKGVRRIKE